MQLNQCLEYTLTSRVPHIFITSGQSNALYSSLLDHADLGKTQPITKFRYTELRGTSGIRIVQQLHRLISKESFLHGTKALEREIERRLPKAQNLEDVGSEFLRKCETFKKQSKTHHMTEEEFREKAAHHSPEVANARMQLKEEVRKRALFAEGLASS